MLPKVLIVEDDGPRRRKYAEQLANGTCLEILEASSVTEALDRLKAHPDVAVAVIDMMLAAKKAELNKIQAVNGQLDGHALGSYLQKQHPTLKILGMTGEPRPGSDECKFFRGAGDPSRAVGVYDKASQWVLLRHHVLHLTGQPSAVKVFIVYGHDLNLRDEAVAFSESELNWEAKPLEPVNGTSWIEQFEEQANEAALAWILASDDEWGCPRRISPDAPAERRPRPNVLLEYGYFLGRFGRRSNRVFLFTRPEVKLGSDVADVATIRLPGSFADARNEILDHHRVWRLP